MFIKLSTIRFFSSYLLLLPLILCSIAVNPVHSQDSAPPAESNNPRPQTDSLLSLQGGNKLMAEAEEAINSEQYDVAAEKLQNARQVFNQLSNFYLQLFDSFSGIDNRLAEGQRRQALESGQLRDEATYKLALVHRSQSQPELSVPLLIQVINSQNPTSELGKKAYQQLFEIGFVDEAFSGSRSNQGNPPANNPNPTSNPNNGGQQSN